MIVLAKSISERPTAAEEPRHLPGREQVFSAAASPIVSLPDEQVRPLVQQLFFRPDAPPLRHAGFTAADPGADTAQLCLSVARILAEEGTSDIGLIDASPGSRLLETRLGLSGGGSQTPRPLATRLWLATRSSWLEDDGPQTITDNSLSRLRHLTSQFDFSVLYCASMSYLTTQVGRTCDGLVLVLTAHRTRRLVAAQMKEQLRRAGVPLLGTVLTERRFPVPQGLYRYL
jgi:Mrp family chromosome partitioning ATPase